MVPIPADPTIRKLSGENDSNVLSSSLCLYDDSIIPVIIQHDTEKIIPTLKILKEIPNIKKERPSKQIKRIIFVF